MEAKGEISFTSFTIVMALTQKCQQNIPERDEKMCFASADVHKPREDGMLCKSDACITEEVNGSGSRKPSPEWQLLMMTSKKRAILNVQRKRFSIASLHSMHSDKKVGPARELVDEHHPVAYKEGSFGEFLDYISIKSLTEGKYIDMLKKI
ncbi:hypothetical protein L1987_41958 [Smallanthus sonchifolius]|uniref:Uncharacterized protein n=3 Tax=Smallanthus sonchifolius TaxID=185202 RepID=A0ACB9GWQ6_9ASTR|nr:hypothetical protein L1987_41956 [Smallanthus sonchifolius]KAI3787466.1 hypothetical protein L1987_41957 [Smallanthus sonchifolius]KAI3787467.1 hypothetical protein L1987_41958 [Smallanthus sonchifolius]